LQQERADEVRPTERKFTVDAFAQQQAGTFVAAKGRLLGDSVHGLNMAYAALCDIAFYCDPASKNRAYACEISLWFGL
jgi:hypothetical protein